MKIIYSYLFRGLVNQSEYVNVRSEKKLKRTVVLLFL